MKSAITCRTCSASPSGHAARSRADDRQANALSVRLELQADCYAGVWGHYAARAASLEPGDAEEGLNAAAAIGDDRLQRMSRGEVIPETFTHGSSARARRGGFAAVSTMGP